MNDTIKDNERSNLIHERIERLRHTLLDLTGRNPLISTKFSKQLNAIVRIVNKTPNQILQCILNRKMRIIALPNLEEELEDEKTEEFQGHLAEWRHTDQLYLEGLDKIDQSKDNALDLANQLERQLKDRLRAWLNMPQRQTKNDPPLAQHAKNHGISPDYELPIEEEANADDRHKDRDIQTLLLPDMLRRRLTALCSKERTYQEETGVSVLHIAFGFLEWGDKDKKQYSPLVLLPVKIEKEKTARGPEFWVSTDEGQAYENKILAEKLELDFDVDFPEFNNNKDLEKYFEEVASDRPREIPVWNVKRWATIGVFPSAKLAMYHDLDTKKWNFSSHEIVAKLFGSQDPEHGSDRFGDEYDVDEPKFENKVPCLITDADSSQFSAIIDVMDGQNLAIEGPPGTGKSQTIVNTIAACLAKGGKVLFIAEKSAALEVVRTRLEKFGLGNFLLPLQVNRSGKKQVIASIKDRIEMQACVSPKELDMAIGQRKEARENLKSYIDTLSMHYGETNFTIHQILGYSIKFSDLIDRLPKSIRNISIPETNKLTADELEDILNKCQKIEETWRSTLNHPSYWKVMQLPNIDRFQVETLLEHADKAAKLFAGADERRQTLAQHKISPSMAKSELETIATAIDRVPENISNENKKIAERLISKKAMTSIEHYLADAKSWKEDKNHAMQTLCSGITLDDIGDLLKIKKLLLTYNLDSLKEKELDSLVEHRKEILECAKGIMKLYQKTLEISDVFKDLAVPDFIKALEIVTSLSTLAASTRKEKLDNPYEQKLFEGQVRKAKSLKEEGDSLEKEFILSYLPEPEVAARHAATLSGAGYFAFLSKKYRQAIKFHKSISKNKSIEKSQVESRLRELVEWQSSLDKFRSNKALIDILYPYPCDIDTDFKPFQETISFFRRIDLDFPDLVYSSLRHFLKHDAALKFLPEIKENDPIHKIKERTFLEIKKKNAELEEALDISKADMKRLKTLKAIFNSPEEMTKDGLARLLYQLEEILERRCALRGNDEVKGILGKSFKAEQTEGDKIKTSLDLGKILLEFEENNIEAFFCSIKNNTLKDLQDLIHQIVDDDAKALNTLEQISSETKTNLEDWLNNKSYADLSQWMQHAAKDKDGLIAYSRFIAAKNKLHESKYRSLVETILSESQHDLRAIVEGLVLRKMAQEVCDDHREILTSYDGIHLNHLRKLFQEKDLEVIRLSREKLQSDLFHNAKPPQGVGGSRKSEYTEMALLRNEIAKKKGHFSIRSITQRSANALLELKPCWMMSPLAVAQYLPKGKTEFDLVIIDEASQMTPENAVGALVRAKQTVVVGDTHQLPPTKFFQRMEDKETDGNEKTTEESILEMANACFSFRQLRWHYRSRDSRLIDFCNKHVYDNRLIIFPTAEKNQDMGVSCLKVNGIYSAGLNNQEAETMKDAIIEFMKKHEDSSLGVVLMNKKQCDLLTEKMDYAMERHQHAKEYRDKWEGENNGLESFFIKNLENVQGDERDVIFIGTVYGPSKERGSVMQQFGPITHVAGKRRLNVLFSRAKKKIVTFTSMTSADIRATQDGNPGAYMLKCWLEYAVSGNLEGGEFSGKEPDSPFEEHVIHQIKSLGCEAIPQVGVAGYYIDIGVKHPNWPHGYLMGVECDGATYHSARSARDRDRLRQEQLESLGWHLYRIWSTDWFEDPIRETQKLREKIESRLANLNKPKIS